MTDSHEGGIRCSYGNGSYTLSSTEGSFTSSDATNFCIDSTKATSDKENNIVTTVNDNDIRLYSNSVQSRLEITTLNVTINTIKVFNMYGALVSSKTISNSNANIDVSELASGTYFIRFMPNDTVIMKKFI